MTEDSAESDRQGGAQLVACRWREEARQAHMLCDRRLAPEKGAGGIQRLAVGNGAAVGVVLGGEREAGMT